MVSGLRVSDDAVAVSPAAPASGRDGNGDYSVVWQDDTDGDGKSEIYLRWVEASGTLVGDPVNVSDDPSRDHSWPQVAMNAAGDTAVVWESRDGSSTVVVASMVKKFGEKVVATISVAGGSGIAEAWMPMVAATPGGLFSIAWVESDPSSKSQRVLGAVFDDDLLWQSVELALSAAAADLVFPTRMYSSEAGEATLEWEAFGGDAGRRLAAATFSTVSKLITQPEQLLAEHQDDGEAPIVEAEWEPPHF